MQCNYTVPSTTHSNEHQCFHCPANSTTVRLLKETLGSITSPFKHKCSSTRSQVSLAIEQSTAPPTFHRSSDTRCATLQSPSSSQCMSQLRKEVFTANTNLQLSTSKDNSVRSLKPYRSVRPPLEFDFIDPVRSSFWNSHFQLRSKLPLGVRLSTSTFNSVRSSFRSSHFQLPLSTPFEAPLGSSTFNFHFQFRSKLLSELPLSTSTFNSVRSSPWEFDFQFRSEPLGLRIEGPPLARAPPGGGNGRLIP